MTCGNGAKSRTWTSSTWPCSSASTRPINGIVMSGPADRHQLQDAYDAATQEVPAEIWGEFEEKFGVGI